MGELGQVLCSCGSFLCQWFCTELENCISSDEYGIIIGRTVLELDGGEF